MATKTRSTPLADKAPLGRPTKFTKEIAKTICERLAKGQTLRAVCRADDMPEESTVRHWALENREGFFAQYEASRTIGYHAMADETLEIADDGSHDTTYGPEGQERPDVEWISRSRLRVDTRKWLLSKALPKIYGDKITQELTGADGATLTPTINWYGRPGPDAAPKAVGGKRKQSD